MPMSCNLNGFQIAEFANNSTDGVSPLSLALYGIFAFSCVGAILFFLLVMKKNISMVWDWFSLIGVILSATVVIYRFGKNGLDVKAFQSGV